MIKKVLYALSFLLIVSCGEIIVETKALIKNQEGVGFLNQAAYPSAIKSFKEAIAHPHLSNEMKALIYRNIGQTYHEMMETDSSLTYFKLAAKCHPTGSYGHLVNTADVKILLGETAEAEKLLLKAVKMKPDDVSANNSLGAIYLGEFGEEFFDPEKALPYNLKAFEINKDRITEDVVGRNYIELKNYKQAREHYTKLHDEYPDMEVLAFQLGVVEYLDGNKEKAEIYFDKVVDKDPENQFFVDEFKNSNP